MPRSARRGPRGIPLTLSPATPGARAASARPLTCTSRRFPQRASGVSEEDVLQGHRRDREVENAITALFDELRGEPAHALPGLRFELRRGRSELPPVDGAEREDRFALARLDRAVGFDLHALASRKAPLQSLRR